MNSSRARRLSKQAWDAQQLDASYFPALGMALGGLGGALVSPKDDRGKRHRFRDSLIGMGVGGAVGSTEGISRLGKKVQTGAANMGGMQEAVRTLLSRSPYLSNSLKQLLTQGLN